MSEPIEEHLSSRNPSDATSAAPAPPWALVVGSVFGALWFFLFALLAGSTSAIAVAAALAIVALVQRMRARAATR